MIVINMNLHNVQSIKHTKQYNTVAIFPYFQEATNIEGIQ